MYGPREPDLLHDDNNQQIFGRMLLISRQEMIENKTLYLEIPGIHLLYQSQTARFPPPFL